MKKSKYSALNDFEDLLSQLKPGETITYQDVIDTIEPQYLRDKQILSTAAMLVQKYGIDFKKE